MYTKTTAYRIAHLPPSRRFGLTLVEVLTSIVVATVGVAGVLILIPFSVRQASVGLDLENATAVGENLVADLQIRGYAQVSWVQNKDILPWITINTNELFSLQGANGIYLVDPLWLHRQANLANANNNLFLQVGPDALMPQVTPQFVNLVDLQNPGSTTSPNPISLAKALQIFQHQDNLIFGVDETQDGVKIDGLTPPQPYFDRIEGPTGPINLRRQFAGDITLSGVAVPRQRLGMVGSNERVEGLDFYVLVYKDRSFEDPASFATNPLGLDPALDPRMRYVSLAPNNPSIIPGSGTINLNAQVELQNDEWIMLVTTDGWNQVKAGFFRVIGSSGNAVTVEGTDFLIPTGATARTFAIHLPGVINVYRRQLIFEY